MDKDKFIDDEERIQLINSQNKEEENSKEYLIQVFDKLERDLIKHHNCPKEFDLDNINNKKNEKIEIFGNPICYICNFSSKKDDSPIQFFFVVIAKN